MSRFEQIHASEGVIGVLREAIRLLEHKDGVGLREVSVLDFNPIHQARISLAFSFLPADVGEGGSR